MIRLLIGSLCACAAASPVLRRQDSISRQTNASDASGSQGAVSSEVGTCSEIGVSLLQQGGSSVDAVIGTALCVEVINSFHSGIGGGGFGIVRFKNGSTWATETIDFRETMPAAGNETMYSNNSNPTASTIGGLSVGVPGHLKGLGLLHERHGKLPWAQIFQPAIDLAANGFTLQYDLAYYLNATTRPFLLSDPLWAEVYAPNGTVAKIGDTITRERLAKTFSFLAQNGIGDFYNGDLAQLIVDAAQKRGGIITRADLSEYEVFIRPARSIQYRNHTVLSIPAPSSGSVALSALKIFEGFDRADLSDRNLSLHRLIQATRFAYGQRTNYGDPRFVDNVTSLEEYYLSDEVATELQRKITPDDQVATAYSPTGYSSLREDGTSAIVAIDSTGHATSIKTTINLVFGSRIMTEAGFVLNDEMDDFSSPGVTNAFGFAPNPANFIRPGKRPLSSISNALVVDANDELVLAVGAAGGSQIITSNIQSLQYSLDYGLRPIQVQQTARWHDQLTNVTTVETRAALASFSDLIQVTPFPNASIAYLTSHAYNVTPADGRSLAQIISRSLNGTLLAAADTRLLAAFAAAY